MGKFEIYKIIELEKIHALTMENSYNLNTYQIIKISLVLYNAHIIPINPDKFVFYINNNYTN